jgi:hypothetical protein
MAEWSRYRRIERQKHIRHDVFASVAVAVLAAVVAWALILWLVRSAGAHSWYPAECCSGHDCAPVEPSRVRVGRGGYWLDGKFIPQANVRRSLDGEYHACFPQPHNLRCFFAPVPAI